MSVHTHVIWELGKRQIPSGRSGWGPSFCICNNSQVMPLLLGPGPHFGKITKRPLPPWNFTSVHPFNGIWKLVAAKEVPKSGH